MTPEPRSTFVLDQNRCTGCQACELACTIENGLEHGRSWRTVHTFNARRRLELPVSHLSLACNHCAEPGCAAACPTSAYRQDPGTGAVLLDQDRCIGCRYCTWACPYGAPRYDQQQGVVGKCTFCVDRLRAGETPACANLCPTGALSVAPRAQRDLAHAVAGFPRSTMRPAIDIVPLAPGRTAPECTEPAADVGATPGSRPAEQITLRGEWTLWLFTATAPWLFALVAARAAGSIDAHPASFVGGALVAAAVSLLHLGRRTRAWRAVLNLRSSWLSREIASFGAFTIAGTAYLALDPADDVAGIAATLAGLASLVCIDGVYRVLRRPAYAVPHSSGALLTGLALASMLAGTTTVAAALGAVKLALYARRKVGLARAGGTLRPAAISIRVGVGMALPAALWSVDASNAWVLACIAVGELVDRAELYAEIDATSPQGRIAADEKTGESPVRSGRNRP